MDGPVARIRLLQSLWKVCLGLAVFVIFPALGSGVSYSSMKGGGEMEGLSPYDRIVVAEERGTITFTESVLLRAKLLFAPQLLKGSGYEPAKGERAVQNGLTGFYKDVHKAFPLLSPQERQFLKSLSPDLKVIINQEEKEEKLPPDRR